MNFWKYEWFSLRNSPHLFIFVLVALVITIWFFVPIIYLFLWSLFGTDTVGILGPFTTQWFEQFFLERGWLTSFTYSISLGLLSSGLALTGAVMFLYFSRREGVFYSVAGLLTLVGPLFFPSVVYALSLRVFASKIAMPETLTLLCGHAALILPLQYLLIEAANVLMNREILENAVIMGAKHLEVIRYVLLPLIRRSLIVAFGIGFLISFDEIVVANMVIDSSFTTVPKRLWEAIHRKMDPLPAVVGCILLVLIISVVSLVRLSRKQWERV